MTDTRTPIVVSISGDPKTGKTHFAFTFPSPVAVIELDYKGSQPLLPKFPEKQIDVFPFTLPIIDSDPPKPYAEDLMDAVETKYEELLESGKYKTFVFDTASMVWRVIGHAEAEATNQKKILRVQYYKPNLRMNALYTRAKLAGVNLVAIQYLAPVYADDKPTGEYRSDGWGQADAAVDVVLRNTRELKVLGRTRETVFHTTMWANRFDPTVDGMVFDNTSYEEIYAILGL